MIRSNVRVCIMARKMVFERMVLLIEDLNDRADNLTEWRLGLLPFSLMPHWKRQQYFDPSRSSNELLLWSHLYDWEWLTSGLPVEEVVTSNDNYTMTVDELSILKIGSSMNYSAPMGLSSIDGARY